MKDAACSQFKAFGLSLNRSSVTTISSAKEPVFPPTITLSSIENDFTSSPISITIPDDSIPSVNGGSGLYWYKPSVISKSGKLTAAAIILIRTSLGLSDFLLSSTTSIEDKSFVREFTIAALNILYCPNSIYDKVGTKFNSIINVFV